MGVMFKWHSFTFPIFSLMACSHYCAWKWPIGALRSPCRWFRGKDRIISGCRNDQQRVDSQRGFYTSWEKGAQRGEKACPCLYLVCVCRQEDITIHSLSLLKPSLLNIRAADQAHIREKSKERKGLLFFLYNAFGLQSHRKLWSEVSWVMMSALMV